MFEDKKINIKNLLRKKIINKMYEDEVGKKNQFYKLSQIKKKMGTKSKN